MLWGKEKTIMIELSKIKNLEKTGMTIVDLGDKILAILVEEWSRVLSFSFRD